MKIPYDWTTQWYAVAFIKDIPQHPQPMPYSVHDTPLAIWRDLKHPNTIHALADKCPHRFAALSAGAVEPDGSLRCFYHGWAFDQTGSCVALPQLEPDAALPRAACVQPYTTAVRENIAWVWMATDGSPPPRPPPAAQDDLDSGAFSVYDFTVEVPYDATFLLENLADPAHIPISHDATSGGGKRESAEAYVMEVDSASMSPSGFDGRYRPVSKPDGWQSMRFEAPGIVRYRREVGGGKVFGAALHCMPLGRGKARLLFRTYFSRSLLPLPARLLLALKPAFLRHLNSCKIIEQDIALITSQEDFLERDAGTSYKEHALPLASSDAFVVAYRKWLDAVADGLPSLAHGWEVRESAALAPAQPGRWSDAAHRSRQSRYERHVVHSRESRTALRRTRTVKQSAIAAFVSSAVIACALPAGRVRLAAASVMAAAAATAALAQRILHAFGTNFERFPRP